MLREVIRWNHKNVQLKPGKEEKQGEKLKKQRAIAKSRKQKHGRY